ncbi:MAG: helix-turn-helix transcriptional regulator [Bacteroidota bacterium]|nr:helix-turn-helix transcriptional regulator [Bacteroidota bacterium]
MKETGIEKVMNVWEKENKILYPNTKEQLIEIVEQIASLFSAGQVYYFIFNLETYRFDFVSDSVKDVLGVEPDTYTLEYFLSLLDPVNIDKLHEKEAVVFNFFLNKLTREEMPLYKVSYLMRLRHSDGHYKTILHQSRTINISHEGKIQQTLCVHTDISYLNIPFDHKISFIGNNRQSYFAIETTVPYKFVENKFKEQFTKREIEILIKIAKGNSYTEIADLLGISPNTINTHKKNILKKAGCKSSPELIARCIREGII